MDPKPFGLPGCRKGEEVYQRSQKAQSLVNHDLIFMREEEGNRLGCLSQTSHGTGKGRCMSKFLARLRHFVLDESGPTAVEYAVMLALIIVVCIAAITTLGTNANSTFSNVALNAAVGGSSS